MLTSTQTVMFAEMMIIIPQVQLGAGRHYQYIKPESNITKGLHLNFVTQPLCLIGLCLTKVSVGLFLLRITPSKRFRYFIWGLMVFTVLSATGNFRECSSALNNKIFLLITWKLPSSSSAARWPSLGTSPFQEENASRLLISNLLHSSTPVCARLSRVPS